MIHFVRVSFVGRAAVATLLSLLAAGCTVDIREPLAGDSDGAADAPGPQANGHSCGGNDDCSSGHCEDAD